MVCDAISLIISLLSEEYPGIFERSDNHALMQRISGKELNNSCSFKQLNIINGEELILL